MTCEEPDQDRPESRVIGFDPSRDAPASEVARAVQTPCLVVDLARVRSNITRLLRYAGGEPERLRPHLKTTKMPVVWREMLRAGIRAFKCATTREASIFADLAQSECVEGADLLVAYPHREPALTRLAAIAASAPSVRMSFACEDPAIARDAPETLGIFIDINSGMNRTGIPPHDTDSLRAVAHAAGDRLRGVHWYEGHLRGESPEWRRDEAERGYHVLVRTIKSLDRGGAAIDEVVTSGTPTFLHALQSPALERALQRRYRVSPGTVIFHDYGYAAMLPEIEFEIAAVLMSRIISRPGEGIITSDAGSKSIAAECGDPCAIALGRPNLRALRPSEEHLPFAVESGPLPDRGEILYLAPRHICPTVNLAEEALVMEEGVFVGFSPIAARAHQTNSTER